MIFLRFILPILLFYFRTIRDEFKHIICRAAQCQTNLFHHLDGNRLIAPHFPYRACTDSGKLT